MSYSDRAYVEIDLDKIGHNIGVIRKKVAGSLILAVIKADAYGHGAVEVARYLSDKTDYFGVALVGEGIQLRKKGITKPILILGNTDKEKFGLVIKYNLIPTIYTYQMAKELSIFAKEKNKNVSVHLEVDSGMSRTGFLPSQLDDIEKVCHLNNINVEGIYSHFASADEIGRDYTDRQYQTFLVLLKSLRERGIEIPIKHISNSAGVLEYPDYNLDMVRVGIMLYGLYPSKHVGRPFDLMPAMQFFAKIIHIKTLDKGVGISYGSTYFTNKETKIATIAIGYADGYPRLLSSRGRVLINGQYAYVLGRVCMDQMMVDITGLDNIKVGDTAILIGGEDKEKYISSCEIASLAGSCSYEILSKVGLRVTRIYKEKGKRIKRVSYLDKV